MIDLNFNLDDYLSKMSYSAKLSCVALSLVIVFGVYYFGLQRLINQNISQKKAQIKILTATLAAKKEELSYLERNKKEDKPAKKTKVPSHNFDISELIKADSGLKLDKISETKERLDLELTGSFEAVARFILRLCDEVLPYKLNSFSLNKEALGVKLELRLTNSLATVAYEK